MYSFRANHIFSDDDGQAVTIGFADDAHEPSRFVILQLAHQFDEQDKKTGMDQLFIQVENQHRSQYGGISSIEVRDNVLVLHLAKSAMLSLQIDDRIQIALDEEHPDVDAAISQLEKIADREGLPFAK